jgi:NAD(P)-dependent dehydrogenase (short-subunit alcohol dehydrogenase family)
MGDRRVALVTGASRGIGRATALALARDGVDLVLTSRSLQGGTVFEGSRLDDDLAGTPLSGSVNEVAAACRAFGVDVVPLALDLTERASIDRAVDDALGAFGTVDVVVSNAVYQGPGLNDRALDVPIELVERAITANAINTLYLFQRLVPPMVARRDGIVIHVTSGAASLDPREAGAWGVGYAMAKAAAHKIIGVLHAEIAYANVRCYNVNPGHVVTDIGRARAAAAGRDPTGERPDVPASTIAWLVEGSIEAQALSGTEVVARRRDYRNYVPRVD